MASLSEGAMQCLVAGARANFGIKAGRYMFEVKILESSGILAGKGKARAVQV